MLRGKLALCPNLSVNYATDDLLNVMLKKIPPLGKGLIAFVLIILGLSLLFAPRPHPVNLKDVSFATTSSSELYFKNLRSYYYNIFPEEKFPFILYRYKRRNRDTNDPHIQFMIIENTRNDEAYVFAELSGGLKQYDSIEVLISNKPPEKASLYRPSDLNNEGQYLLAAEVFENLLTDRPVFLMNGRDTLSTLFKSDVERKNAAIVLEDYFKLVNKI